ncbi:MAG: hypothetical protein ACLU62_12430 [Hydrogeniiclostridium sp.]
MKKFQKAKEKEDWEQDPFFASEDQLEEESSKKPKNREHWLTVIQITVCAVVLLAAVCMKFFGGEWYEVIRSWYVEHVNQSILTDEDLQNMEQKVLELFPAASHAPVGEESKAEEESSSEGKENTVSSQTNSESSFSSKMNSDAQAAESTASSGG